MSLWHLQASPLAHGMTGVRCRCENQKVRGCTLISMKTEVPFALSRGRAIGVGGALARELVVSAKAVDEDGNVSLSKANVCQHLHGENPCGICISLRGKHRK